VGCGGEEDLGRFGIGWREEQAIGAGVLTERRAVPAPDGNPFDFAGFGEVFEVSAYRRS